MNVVCHNDVFQSRKSIREPYIIIEIASIIIILDVLLIKTTKNIPVIIAIPIIVDIIPIGLPIISYED